MLHWRCMCLISAISLCSTDPDNVMQGRHVVIVLAPDTSQSSQCSCRIASTNVGRGGRINVTLVSIRSLGRSDYCLALVQFDVHGSSGDVGFCAGNQKAAGSAIVSGHAWDVHLQLRQRHPYLTRLSISVEGWQLLFVSPMSSLTLQVCNYNQCHTPLHIASVNPTPLIC